MPYSTLASIPLQCPLLSWLLLCSGCYSSRLYVYWKDMSVDGRDFVFLIYLGDGKCLVFIGALLRLTSLKHLRGLLFVSGAPKYTLLSWTSAMMPPGSSTIVTILLAHVSRANGFAASLCLYISVYILYILVRLIVELVLLWVLTHSLPATELLCSEMFLADMCFFRIVRSFGRTCSQLISGWTLSLTQVYMFMHTACV